MIGALIGKQEGRNIEVMNSFELLSHTVDERAHIDKEYYYTKEEQCERNTTICALVFQALSVSLFILRLSSYNLLLYASDVQLFSQCDVYLPSASPNVN